MGRARAARDGARRHDDRGFILQLIEAAGRDHLAGGDAVHLRFAAIRDTRLDAALVCDIALNHIHEGSLTILLNGG